MSILTGRKVYQYLISFSLITLIAIIAHFTVDLTGYKVVALMLLLAVSMLAMVFDIWPVVLASIYSALVWNYFFIPPLYNYTIGTPEDVLLFLMYFVIAMLNAVLTSKIRKAEMKAKEEEERKKTIALFNTILNSLSHELKTPISTIIGAVDSLRETPSRLTEEHRKDLLTEIETASMRLNRQVGNLLNMSRLESGFLQPQLDWCDVAELIHRVTQMVLLDDQDHTIKVEIDDDLPLFKLDSGFIEQSVYNIIHNAIQYTPGGSIIKLKVEHQDGSCLITISDNGPGFPVQEIESVFKKFYRLPHTRSGGIGLGLSIVKGFIEAHHGTIQLENLDQGGSKFTLRIPAAVSHIKDIHHE